MGLKIGQFLKKNIRFKNVVKLASTAVPGVGGAIIGGLQEAHEAKKLAKQEKDEHKRQEKLALAEQKAMQAGTLAGRESGTLAGQFVKSAVKNTYNGASEDTKDALAYVGTNVGVRSLKIWFTENWKKVALFGGAVLAAFFLWKRSQPKRRRW